MSLKYIPTSLIALCLGTLFGALSPDAYAKEFVVVVKPPTISNTCSRFVFAIMENGQPAPVSQTTTIKLTTGGARLSETPSCVWDSSLDVQVGDHEFEFWARPNTADSTVNIGAKSTAGDTITQQNGLTGVISFNATPPTGYGEDYVINQPVGGGGGVDGQASGAVVRHYIHQGGSDGEGVLLFRVGSRTGGPSCSTAGSGHEFAISLGKQMGHGVLSTLLYAAAQGRNVSVVGTGACDDFSDRESVKYVVLSH